MGKLATNRLEQLESEIENGFRSIGKALIEIRDTKAYLDYFDTFEAYCNTRWKFSVRHAQDLITAESVREKIGRILPTETIKTQHLLEISKVHPSKQAHVAASVAATCESEKREPTAKDYKSAAKEFLTPKTDPKPAPVEVEYEDVPDEPVKQSDTPQALAAPIQAAASQLNGLLKLLQKLADDNGGQWLNMTDIETKITALKGVIRSACYWVECPDCDGKGCRTCRKHGWLSLDRKNYLTQAQKDKLDEK